MRRFPLFTKWFLRTLVSLLVLILLCLGCVGFLIGTESGRKLIVQKIPGFLPAHIQLHVEGLASASLGQWQASRLHVIMNNKDVLIVEKFALHFDFKALLDRHVHIASFSAQQLSLFLPESEKGKNSEQQKSLSIALPENFPEVTIDELQIQSVAIFQFQESGQQLLFPESSLEAAGFWHRATPLEIDLSLQSLNEKHFSINISSNLDAVNSQTTLHAEVKEQAGGFIGGKLKLPVDQNLDARFQLNHKLAGETHELQLSQLEFPLFDRNFNADASVNILAADKAFKDIHLQLSAEQNALLEVNGSIVDNTLDLSLMLHSFSLDLIQAWVPEAPKAILSGGVKLKGKPEALIVETELAGALFQHSDRLPFKSRVDYDNAEVKIHYLETAIDAMTARLAGKVNLRQEQLDLELVAKTLQVERVLAFFPGLSLPVEDLHVENLFAKVRGPYTDPQKLEGEVNADMHGRYLNEALSLQVQLAKQSNRVTVRKFELEALNGLAHASGDIDIQTRELDLQFVTRAFPVESLTLLKVPLPEGLEAILDADVKASGNLTKPLFELSANAHGRYEDIPFSLSSRAHGRQDDIEIEIFTLKTFDEDVLNINGQLTPTDIALNLQAGNVPAKLFQAFGWYENIGKISANIQVAAVVHEKAIQHLDVNGNLHYSAAFNVYDQQGEKSTLPFDWQVTLQTVKDELILSSNLDSLDTDGGELRAVFSLPPYLDFVNHKKPLHELPLKFNLQGNTRLRLFSLMVDPDIHRFSGELTTVLKLDGNLGQPDLKGSIEIADSAYENTVSGTVLRNAACKLEAVGHLIRLYECQADDGYQGSFQLTGDFDLGSLIENVSVEKNRQQSAAVSTKEDRINLELVVDKANLLKHPAVDMLATGKLNISGSTKTLLASGEIEISPLTAFLDETEWGASIPELDVEEIHEGENASEANSSALPMPTILLDITISTHHQAWLRGRGLEAELEGDIKIRGSTKDVRYEGEFRTVRGSMEFFGKKFILETGVVNFVNESVFISLPAVYEKQGVRIRALVKGSGNAISVELSSTPAMPEDEILAYIIFGKTIKKMTAIEALQVANAVQKLRGSSSSFFDPIATTRELLGADTLYVQSADGQEGEQGLNVGVGKYLSEKVYLELEYTPDPTQPWKGRIEVELTPRLSLESTAGGKDGTVGAELKWKKDY